MVKADAYNHGMRICKHIEKEVDCFGVSTANEGKYLRQIGIKKLIKVVAFEKKDILDAITFDLVPVIADISTLKALVEYGIKKDFCIDLKIDCGMNRLGINSIIELYEVLSLIKQNKSIKIKTLFSHFSFSDYENMQIQNKRFLKICSLIEEELGERYKCICASSGLIFNQEFLYDEVRVGLAMYGYLPCINDKIYLKKAMSVTVPIIAIKHITKGQRIGYSGLYSADKNVNIGIIRGGYYDGLNRLLTGCKVIINGRYTMLIGNVCMDLAFVLLDGINAKVGDNVLIIGEDNDIDELARHCSTIPYEIMTNFKGRFERLYYT